MTHRQWVILQQALCSFRDLIEKNEDMSACLHWDEDEDGPLPSSEEIDDLVVDVIIDLQHDRPIRKEGGGA